MKKALFALLVASVFVCGFLVGHKWHGNGQNKPIQVKIDTLIIRDTITQEKPVPVKTYIVDTEWVACLVDSSDVVHDTLFVPVPISRKIYQDSTYRAVISGYHANLDTISVFQKTQYVTKEITKLQKVRSRWGLGIQAGYGIAKDGLTPYVGLGVSYNLLSW